MKKPPIRHSTLVAAVAALSVLPMAASATEPYAVLHDDFTNPPNALNTNIWARSGVFTPVHIVSDGQLTMRSAGWAHHATITSVMNTFNFFESEYTVEATLVDLTEPDWDAHPIDERGRREVYFILGPAATWDEYRDWDGQYYQFEGFAFSLRWQVTSLDEPASGGLFLHSDNEATGIGNPGLSNLPTGISYTVDASTFTIELEGATFVDTGLSSLSGTHSLDDTEWDDRYYFMVVLHQYALDVNVPGDVVFDSITVFGEPPPAPTEWAGYEILDDSWIDTGAWLGYLNVALSPWIYSDRMQRWIYLPEDHVFAYGAWLYAHM